MAKFKSIFKQRLTKRLLIAFVMLTTAIALSAPGASGAMDFCRSCQLSCEADWLTNYSRCVNNGGTMDNCTQWADGAANDCIRLCNYSGCKIPLNIYIP